MFWDWNRRKPPAPKPVAPKPRRMSSADIRQAEQACEIIVRSVCDEFAAQEHEPVVARTVGKSVISGAQVCWPVYEGSYPVRPGGHLNWIRQRLDWEFYTLFWHVSDGPHYRLHLSQRFHTQLNLQFDQMKRDALMGEPRGLNIIASKPTREEAEAETKGLEFSRVTEKRDALQERIKEALLKACDEPDTPRMAREVLRLAVRGESLSDRQCDDLLTISTDEEAA